MADFITFDEGQERVGQWGLPTTCSFDLSSKSVDSTSPFVETDNFASRAVITGTGYAAQTQAAPTVNNGTAAFTQESWATGAETDWTSPRSCVLTDGTLAICAWNLQTGGGARTMGANTTENFTGTLVLATG